MRNKAFLVGIALLSALCAAIHDEDEDCGEYCEDYIEYYRIEDEDDYIEYLRIKDEAKKRRLTVAYIVFCAVAVAYLIHIYFSQWPNNNDLLTKVGIAFGGLTFILTSERFYNQEWRESMDPIISDFRLAQLKPNGDGSETLSEAANAAWEGYSNSLYVLVMLPALVAYFLGWRARSFYYLFVVMAIVAVTQIGKLYYQEARPFWDLSEIRQYNLECSTGYGNPSGHNLSVMGVFFAIYLDYDTWSTADRKKDKPSVASAWYIRSLIACSVLVITSSMGYSRLVLGVHSWNQIVYGQLLGIWFALIFEQVVKDWLIELVQSLLDAKESHNLAKMLTNAILFLGIIFGIQIVQYEKSKQVEVPSEWVTAVEEFCGKDKLDNAFNHKALTSFAQIGAIWGAYFGLLAQRKWTPGIFVQEPASRGGFGWNFARLGAAILTCLPTITLILLFRLVWKDLTGYSRAFVAEFLPMLLAGFSLFFVADVANRDFGLYEATRKVGKLIAGNANVNPKRDQLIILIP